MKKHYKLAIAIRCHAYPLFVLDTVDALFHYADTSPLVVLSIDNSYRNDDRQQKAIVDVVQKVYPQVRCYCSSQNWGWGPGLYGLLCDTVHWLDSMKDVSYDHFLTIDYDTLFIGRGPDAKMVAMADGYKNVGLIGRYIHGKTHWRTVFNKHRAEIIDMLGGVPPTYEVGESVHGCSMFLTKIGLKKMHELGLFSDPFRNVKQHVPMADDPWTALMIRKTGLDIKGLNSGFSLSWQQASDYETYIREGYCMMHPAKVYNNNRRVEIELRCRNFFRKHRGKKLLSLKDVEGYY